MSEYTDKQIKAVDTALAKMKENTKLMDGHEVRQAMAAHGDPYMMVEVMKSDLRLIVSRGDMWALTSEGKKAAKMGFGRYLRYLKVKEFFTFWGPVVSIVAAIISSLGALLSWII